MSEPDKREQLLAEVETAIARYRKLRNLNQAIHWPVLLMITIAGFFTTAAGVADSESAWFASQTALTIWGLIAAIGGLVVQNYNPEQKALRFEKKKDAMRAIRTALKYRELDVAEAALLVEKARLEPADALEDLANQENAAQ